MTRLPVCCLVLLLVGTVKCQLWPYGEDNGDRVMDKNTIGIAGSNAKSIIFELDQNIKIFDDQTNRLRIFEHGIISHDLDFNPTLCAQSVHAGPYLSAFWLPTDIQKSGAVYYRQETKANSNSGLDYEALVEEISRGVEVLGNRDFFTGNDKKSTMTVHDVESVIVITWEKMVQPSSFFANPTHSNTFQMVLVVTSKGTYKHTVYTNLDYFHFVSWRFYCQRAAVAAVTYDTYHFEMTAFFYLDPSNIQILTNIINYTKLGRYVVILKVVKAQPAPPRLNCDTENPDQYCKTGLPPKFCKYRPTGRYKHPSFCNKFVLCNGDTADVQQCGYPLVYNPWIQNCDWKHMYYCVDAVPNIRQMFDAQMRLGNFNSLVKIEYDVINLHFAIHNNTCAGVPNWGNAVDISSCEHYLMCSNTRTFMVPCPPSYNGEKLYYNPEKNYCDYQKNVICEDGKRPGDGAPDGEKPRVVIITPPPIVTQSTEVTEPVTLPPDVNPCQRRGFLNAADPTSCDHYYSCRLNKIDKRFACPNSWNGKSLYYDSEKNQCVYRHEVKCNRDDTTQTTTAQTTTARPMNTTTPYGVPNPMQQGER